MREEIRVLKRKIDGFGMELKMESEYDVDSVEEKRRSLLRG